VSRPSVLISILSWESPRYLANLLDNITAFRPAFRARAHIHILEQGSSEETRALVRRFVASGAGRTAEYLDRNLGFTSGHNRVFDTVYRRFRFDYFMVLNQDALFGRAAWADRLVDAMEADPSVAIGGPSAWERSARPGTLLESCDRATTKPEAVFSIQGSVAIIRTAVVERLGLFDTVFTPAYFEDTDLCRRYVHAGHRLGWFPIEYVHAYLGDPARLIIERRAELRERFGDFDKRNRTEFLQRWLVGEPLKVTPELVRRRWPTVYFPSGTGYSTA